MKKMLAVVGVMAAVAILLQNVKGVVQAERHLEW